MLAADSARSTFMAQTAMYSAIHTEDKLQGSPKSPFQENTSLPFVSETLADMPGQRWHVYLEAPKKSHSALTCSSSLNVPVAGSFVLLGNQFRCHLLGGGGYPGASHSPWDRRDEIALLSPHSALVLSPWPQELTNGEGWQGHHLKGGWRPFWLVGTQFFSGFSFYSDEIMMIFFPLSQNKQSCDLTFVSQCSLLISCTIRFRVLSRFH